MSQHYIQNFPLGFIFITTVHLFLFSGKLCQISCPHGGGTDTWVGSNGNFNVGYSLGCNFFPLELTKCSLHTLVESRIGRFSRPILCIHCLRRDCLLIGKQPGTAQKFTMLKKFQRNKVRSILCSFFPCYNYNSNVLQLNYNLINMRINTHVLHAIFSNYTFYINKYVPLLWNS